MGKHQDIKKAHYSSGENGPVGSRLGQTVNGLMHMTGDRNVSIFT